MWRQVLARYGRVALPSSARRQSNCATSPQSSSAVFYPETVVTELSSGLRVVSENTHLPTTTIGVYIDAGSRYETERNNGVAHFLEHMIFKGTKRRSQLNLELEVENRGAHLNAYTSREQTVYYAKCFRQDVDYAVDVLSDILLNSRLGEGEVERERGVILREMEEVEQNMQEVVFDRMHEATFAGNPLSFTILGPRENINSLKRNDLLDYVRTHYHAPRMVVVGAGGVDHDLLCKLAERHFADLPKPDEPQNAAAPFQPAVFHESETRLDEPKMPLLYGAIAVEAVGWTHPHNLTLMLANTLLGEWDATRAAGVALPSRLAARLEGVAGISSFLAFNTCYKETGLSGLYFVCQPEASSQLISAVTTTWRWLAGLEGEIDELKQAIELGKRSLLTNMLLMLDGSTPVAEDIGKQMLSYGRRIPLPELTARIQSITPEYFMEVCAHHFLRRPIATSVVGPVRAWPKNEAIHAALLR